MCLKKGVTGAKNRRHSSSRSGGRYEEERDAGVGRGKRSPVREKGGSRKEKFHPERNEKLRARRSGLNMSAEGVSSPD